MILVVSMIVVALAFIAIGALVIAIRILEYANMLESEIDRMMSEAHNYEINL